MSLQQKDTRLRLLVLISTQKLSEKAGVMLREAGFPLLLQINGMGTVSSETLDLLGFGSVDKSLLVSIMSKMAAEDTLKKLKRNLKLVSANSGIAFTLPITAVNSLMLKLQMTAKGENTKNQTIMNQNIKLAKRKENTAMADMKQDMKNVMIAAIVNQGYSDEVMKSAREAGASGGTVIHSRRIGAGEITNFCGLSVNEEQEMVLIIAAQDSKKEIMEAIGEKCGMRSEAGGVVLALPIDSVIGISELE